MLSVVPRDRDSREDAQAAVVLLSGRETGGRLALAELTLIRGAAAPRHRHHWEDEVLYVLDGELAVCVGGTWRRAPAGAAALLPRGIDHAVAAVTARARVLTILTPAGFEEFYQELGGAPADLERLVTAAARHGCEITGPPPDPPPEATYPSTTTTTMTEPEDANPMTTTTRKGET